MVEPTYTVATEDTYGSLAEYLRTADRRDGSWPLKRFLAPILDQLGVVRELYDRIDYLSPDEFGADTRPLDFYTNLALNPSYEDADPLPVWTLNAAAGRSAPAAIDDSGQWSWRFVAAADGEFGGSLITNRMPVTSGVVTVSAAVYAFPGRTVRFTFDVFDGAGTLLGQVHADVPYAGPGYQRLDATVALLTGGEAVELTGFVLGGVAGEEAHFDAALVTDGPAVHPYRRYMGIAAGETSELATPETADDAWLPWLAQLVGVVRLNPELTREAKVDAIRYASAGWQGGTKAAVAAAAKSVLTGTKYVKVYDHSTAAGVGTGGEWDVLLVTRLTETPDVSAVLAAVVAQQAKPAGVVLHHLAYNASWADIQAAYPTWAAWQTAGGHGTWSDIEEAGL